MWSGGYESWVWDNEYEDYYVGTGEFIKELSERKVAYKIKEPVAGYLQVGETINIRFYEGSWTNKSVAFPKEAVLILEPIMIAPYFPSGTPKTNNYLKHEYWALGGDAHRGVQQYTGAAQLSNIVSNIKEYTATPTNCWLAVHTAKEIAVTYLRANPPANEYDRNTRYFFDKAPYRYRVGWIVLVSVENGFFGGTTCSVTVGDDKQIKYVELR